MKKNSIPPLPDGELDVMQAVWACAPPVTRAQIHEILENTHPMAPTTLLTVLSRLAKKGFLRIEKATEETGDRFSRYIPLISQAEYLASQSRRFFDRLCGGSLPAFAEALCDSGLSREELEELRRLLKEDAI